MLALFLPDMRLLAARNVGTVGEGSAWLLAHAIACPLVNAALALVFGWLFGISAGNTILLMVLAASAFLSQSRLQFVLRYPKRIYPCMPACRRG